MIKFAEPHPDSFETLRLQGQWVRQNDLKRGRRRFSNFLFEDGKVYAVTWEILTK